MADHIDNPYVDFYYGDRKHDFRPISGYASDFHLYRVSSSKRYNDNLIPTLTDKTADVPGADGMYFFNTYYKQKQFTINVAFDKLNDADLREIRNWLNGKEIKDLIFDEFPQVAYKAKVTGAPNLKFVPFDEVTNKKTNNTTANIPVEDPTYASVYKGDGTITFTCYYPYGESIEEYHPDHVVGGELPTVFNVVKTKGVNAGDIWAVQSTTDLVSSDPSYQTIYTVKFLSTEQNETIYWDSGTGLITKKVDGKVIPLNFSGTSYGTIDIGTKVRIMKQIGEGENPTYEALSDTTFSFRQRYY